MRKINKKLLSIILTLAMVVTMIPMFGVTASAAETATNVAYVNADGVAQTPVTATVVSEDDTTWGDDENDGWYVVNSDVESEVCYEVSGDIKLILADGCTLSVDGCRGDTEKPGIKVTGESNTLTIYGQSGGTGKLIAKGDFSCAGIGGSNNEAGSNITINGGIVTATGLVGAGIGGGKGAVGSNITINGGFVTASGSTGIGNGDGASSPASNILVSENLILKADNNDPPETLITHTSSQDIAGDLANAEYVTIETPWYTSGDGTSPDKAYIISNYDWLNVFAAYVNSGNNMDGKYIKLADDFGKGNGKASEQTIPIGDRYQISFDGNFDGNGQTVTLNINVENSDIYNAGMFGFISYASVKNVTTKGTVIAGNQNSAGGVVGYSECSTINGCNTAVNITVNDDGWAQAGGVVGYSEKDIITNCSATGTVTMNGGGDGVGGIAGQNEGGSITNCYATGAIKAIDGDDVGGLVGYCCDGTINNCYATGDVTVGEDASAGGVIGYQEKGTTINCYATGEVAGGTEANVGGVVGKVNSGTIINCFATGEVTGGAEANVGGVVGYQYNYTTLINCYATGEVTGGADALVGCVEGYYDYGIIRNCYYLNNNNFKGIGETSKDTAGKTTALIDAQMKAKAGETNSNWKSITVDGAVLGNIALVDALNKYAKSEEGKNLGCKTWTQSAFMNQGYPTFGVEKKTGIMQLVIKGIAAISGLKLVKSAIFSPVILKLFKWSTIFKIFK